jgi:hypothetical protein
VTQKEYVDNLFEVLDQLDEALFWLERSHGICKDIGIKEKYEAEEYDAFETLTSRFARTSDMVLQKVFRSIDRIEFEKEGTLLDVLNRSHKRGLIESIDEVREIRELRNDISHEYAPTNLKDIFADALKLSESLIEIIDRVKEYSQKFRTPTEVDESPRDDKD